tara:strand:+ start:4079 stop:5989 length:1911 start_codon:yes stop_codon:yes gene_type:complete
MKLQLFLIYIFFLLNSYSFAINSNTDEFEGTKVNILLGKKYENTIELGLNFNIRRDWKIYWIYPGDAGLPPELKILDNKKYKSITPSWPFPEEELDENSELISRIYKDEIIIPYKILLSEDIKSIQSIEFELDYQICKDICIPVKSKLTLDIPKKNYVNPENLKNIEKFKKKVPVNLPSDHDVEVTAKKLDDNNILLNLKGSRFLKANYRLENLILINNELPPLISKKINQTESGYKVTLRSFTKLDPNINKSVIFLKINESNFFYKKLTNEIKENQNYRKQEISLILLSAFLAGIILNFMPCVLPVLGIKINNLLKQSETRNKLHVKLSSLYVSLGILSTFFIFAIISVIFRLIGFNLGWGMQFQSPIFLLLLLFLLSIFALVAFDLLKMNSFQRIINISSFKKLINKNNLFISNYATGILSTLLATPCTAPLVGSAISFALSQNYFLSISVFLLMGLGKSLPYIVFILRPNILLHLPKPGKWMKYIKVFIGIMLLISVLWLSKLLINHYIDFPKSSKSLNIGYQWEEFDAQILESYINNNEKIFLDFTAEWCINCKINKKLVIEDKEVIQFLNQKHIKLIRGDWTFPDEEILIFLKKYQRYGIPFNIFFSEKYPNGYIFSEVLNKNTLLRVLAE